MRQQGSHLAPKESLLKKEHRVQHSAPSTPKRKNERRPDAHYYDDSATPSRQKTNTETPTGRQKGPGGVARFFIIVAILMIFGIIGVFGAVRMIASGPSTQAKKLFVRTLDDTSTLRKIPYLFMSSEEVLDALDANKDTSEGSFAQYPDEIVVSAVETEKAVYENTIELKEIRGTSWEGKMLLVHDPSLLILGTPNDSAGNEYGDFLEVSEFVNKYHAFAGTTASGYRMDTITPYGFVINHGELLYCESDKKYNTVAFSYDHIMTIEKMTAQQALDAGYDFAVCWIPVLIKDGVKQTNLGGGFNPRAAIGQTADGTIILVVIEGRMISSLGATYDELADLMEEYGAINAINLDSGKSSMMIYDGEQVTKVAMGSGLKDMIRTLPNAFLVMPEESSK